MNSPALVSIVIPAYKPQFFEKALYSAMIQDYAHIEIVICDDCPDDGIATIVERLRPVSRFPVRYFRNQPALKEYRNVARGIREAQGEFVKFLYDDDMLLPGAVGKLVVAMQLNPGVSLASAKRLVVDEQDKVIGETIVTIYPFKHDVLINGQELASFLGEHIYNFIGEPSMVMCRRADVLAFGDNLMFLAGQVMHWVGDLAIYVKLLRQGNLLMLKDTVGCFRVSDSQWSAVARAQSASADAPYVRFREAVQSLGWVRPSASNTTVKVARLDRPEHFHDLELAEYFSSEGVVPMGNAAMQAWFNTVAKATPVRHWLAQRRLTTAQQQQVVERRQQLAGQLSVLVVVADCQADSQALELTLQSLSDWRASTTTRLDWQVISAVGSQWVEALNAQLLSDDHDWLLVVQAGDQLLASGTLMLDLELAGADHARLVYCDELYRGERDLEAVLRPGPNLDYLLSLPAAMSGHWLLRREQALAAGGFDAAQPEACGFDMILRLIEAGGLQGIAHLSEPLLICDAPTIAANPGEVQSLQRHLALRGYRDAQVAVEDGRRYRITYNHVERPLVSIVVMADQSQALLERCLRSLLVNTRYPFFEVLVVDHGIDDDQVRSALLNLQRTAAGKLRIVDQHAGSTRPAAINATCRQARGDYIVLLEGDVAAVRADWLDELLNHGQRPEVAVVGGKVVTADGKVRHAGLIAGLSGAAASAFEGVQINQRGFMQRLVAVQNYSAVSSACMLVRKAVWLEVAGLDEALAPGLLSDLDLCLRIGQAGHLLTWTPYAMLVQHARPAVEHPAQDVALIQQRWVDVLANDPAYNVNCTLSGDAFALEVRAGLNWRPLPWLPQPVVLAYGDADEDALESRVSAPLAAMAEYALADGALIDGPALNAVELRRLAPSVVVFQAPLSELPLQAMADARLLSDVAVVLEVRAFISPAVSPIDPVQRWEQLTQAAALADRIVVPTQALADAFVSLHADVRVQPTLLGMQWRELPAAPAQVGRMRIGCCIEPSSSLDPAMLRDVIQALAGRVDWVLWGEVSEALRALAHEVHDGMLQGDPAALSALQLNLALAPLGDSGLERCRSALPLLQFGACGYPVVCSDVPAYANALPVERVANTALHWLDAIEALLAQPAAAHAAGRRLQQQVRQEGVLDEVRAAGWLQAWAQR
ncbi:glycosyltransferase [Pseudomonas kurunegalensis]|uniref:glycosyltransferase n=1 Tax=Pseudomonas kurunegalensis TaxID=485880 RepID=UPI002117B23B|nr:glycosyltransferase family 2 protein [Pseudomonas kurunegalensis]